MSKDDIGKLRQQDSPDNGESERHAKGNERSETATTFVNKSEVTALTIAVVLIAGLGVLIGGSSSVISSWFRSETIKATSLQRPSTDIFMAGEKIRFSLHNIKSERVIWIFDERESRIGNVETEYEYPFNADQPVGIAADHRIDVFFKDGGEYKVITTVVRIQNSEIRK